MHLLGWRYVFYVGGILSILWSLIWYFAVHDNPEEHPRISKSELTLIKESIGDKVSKESVSRLPIQYKYRLDGDEWSHKYAELF